MAYKRINITIPEELYWQLKKIAETEGIPISTYIRIAVEKKLKQTGA